MDIPFWHDRWENNKIGFHLDAANPILAAYWSEVMTDTGVTAPRVFVPMAGKSLDLVWLADQGCEVVGVEVNERAVNDFFTELGQQAEVSQHGELRVCRAGKITLICGDYFALQAADIGSIDIVYDRAAFVAMPPDMRQKYASQLARLCPDAPRLLVTLEYDQAQMAGPPFAVSEEEVLNLYAKGLKTKTLAREDALPDHAHFAAKGLTSLNECVYYLAPNPD